jgi:hypothetical protein
MKSLALAALLFLAAPSEEVNYKAASVNVAEPGTPVTIRILRWSTDAERSPLLATLNPAPATPARNPNAAETGAAAGGRGRAGRGRGRGGPAAPVSPIAAFTAALGRGPTIGYIWTSDITGYSIKYAWHSTQPDGTERVILASDRRLGAYTNAWKPSTPASETDYTFTLVELRTGPQGVIEGKTSLTNKIVVDAEAKTVALENYAAAAASLTATSASGRSPRPSR